MSVRRICVKASLLLALGAWLTLFAACGGGAKSPARTPSPTDTPRAGETPSPGGDFRLSSDAFENEESIPARFTCDGENASPPLAWSGAPAETQSFALIMDDPDAPGGVFTHWVLFDLPAETSELPEGVETSERPQVGGVQGSNDADSIGYGGPCPPSGPAHRYRFTLYALDGPVNLDPGAKKQEVLDTMDSDILAQAELVGTYGR